MVNRSGRERFSVPFFAIPDFDAVVECLPSCRGPGNSPSPVGAFMQHSNATDWNKDGPVVRGGERTRASWVGSGRSR